MNDTALRDLLRASDPATDARPYSDEQIARLTERITTSVEAKRGTARPRRRGRRFAIAAGVAAAVAISPVIKFGLQPPISAAAADILIQAANSVTDGPEIHAGQYWKITTQQWQSDGRRSTHVMYVPAIGEGPKYIGILEKDEFNQPLNSWYKNNQPKGYTGQWSDPTPEFIAALPKSVEEIRNMLYVDAVGHGSTLDGEVFRLATDFLRYGGFDADVRQRMLRVLATIPYVEISEESVTVDGRTGVGIRNAELVGAYDFLGKIVGEGGLRGHEIILDVTTGEIIGERNFWMGQVTYTASRTRELVDEVPADVIKNALE